MRILWFALWGIVSAQHASENVGWQSGPDSRGTLDILWSCTVTIFLCSWTVLCINVPARTDGEWYMFGQKIFLTILSILGPEFVMMSAIGQLQSARRSVADFRDSGYEGWTLKHAFFADMGGFVLQTPDWVEFPIDAKQTHYLVTNGYMNFPTTERIEIEDRNKNDTLVRIITVSQASWFLMSWIARFSQRLAVTTMEMTTIGFIFCALVTCYCWWDKPADIRVPTVVKIDTPLRDILIDAGDAASQPYRLTPLDFVSDRDWSWGVYWAYWVKWFSPVAKLRSRARPLKRIPNDNFPAPTKAALNFLMFVNSLFAAVNIAAWNFTFPTPAERLLWRISTLAIPASLFTFWILDMVLWNVWPRLSRKPSKEKSAGMGIDFGVGRDPSDNISLPAIAMMTFVASIYTAARGYIVLEDLLSLRSAPAGIYKTVQWTMFLPTVN